jgi:MFS family permease
MALVAARGGLSQGHHWIILLVVVGLWLGQAILAGWLADYKGRQFWVYVVAALIVGPLVLLVALLLPRPREVDEDSETRPGELPPRLKRFGGIDD